jgi:hypothetical protein
MRKDDLVDDSEEPLVDTTAAIPLHSKRTTRQQKKRQKKEKREKAHKQHATLNDLPSELVMDIFKYLRPSDLFILSRVNHGLREFILDEEARLCKKILPRRYAALSKCFQLPVLMEKVDESAHPALKCEERQELLNIHKKPYQHIKAPDPQLICTCLTCMLNWNNLCIIVDFADWQPNLDKGEPIPIIPRGKFPEWNQALITANAAIVEKALYSPLWYARILEQHLNSTVRSIRRHFNNKGNKRRRFRMSAEDAASESDLFLERSGPPSMEPPFHRDNYYMLEAYLPFRGWNAEKDRWMYLPTWHERDVEMVKSWMARKERERAAQAAAKAGEEAAQATAKVEDKA